MRRVLADQGSKPTGFIITRSHPKETVDTSRALSLERPMPSHTLSSIHSINSHSKMPGQIHKKPREDTKVDEETFYNSDLYDRPPKVEHRVRFEETNKRLFPARGNQNGQQEQLARRENILKEVDEEIGPEQRESNLQNVHPEFDLSRYRGVLQLLERVNASLSLDEPDILRAVEGYLVECRELGEPSCLRLVASKRQIIKEVWVLERELMLMICFAVAANNLARVRKWVISLLQYAIDNHIVVLSVLTGNSGYAQQLLIERGRRHLLGKSFDVLRSHQDLMASLIYKIAKSDPLFAQEFVKISDSHAQRSIKDFAHSLLTFFAFYLSATKSQHSVPFLAVAPAPFLPTHPNKEYTLAIDCLRVFPDLSVSQKTHRKHVPNSFRPYSQHFLNEMSAYFEIVSWSHGLPLEHNRCVGGLDKKGRVRTKLHRYHCEQNGSKEVEKLGRDPDRVIVLDTVDIKQNRNILWVPCWRGQSNDAVLAELCPLLAAIVVKQLNARESIAKIRRSQEQSMGFGLRHMSCGVQL